MSHRTRFVSAILTLLTVVSSFSMLLANDAVLSEDRDWSDATPTEIHQKMGADKARALSAAREARQFVPVGALANAANYDVKMYDINIRVNDTTEVLYGRVGFVVERNASGRDDRAI